ncbi:MAG: helix-hairpin-helix domain-containing protein [Candidatus Bathyarchaeia archaeon]|nr:hypothetical protein [Candidatus Bathyarchaeota archaeon]
MIATDIAVGILVSVAVISIFILGFHRFRKHDRNTGVGIEGCNPTEGGVGRVIDADESPSIEFKADKPSIQATNITGVDLIRDTPAQIDVKQSSDNSLEVLEEPTPTRYVRKGKREGLRMIRGIGEKREEKLLSIGIHSIEDLAKADPKELAVKLKVSEKLTSTWIEEARSIVSRKR